MEAIHVSDPIDNKVVIQWEFVLWKESGEIVEANADKSEFIFFVLSGENSF